MSRETVRCGSCALPQFRPWSGLCRRCGGLLALGSIETTAVIYVAVGAAEGSVGALPESTRPNLPILPICQVIEAATNRAVLEAVRQIPHTTKAARALGISHGRLKKLLRQAGDTQDRRYHRPGKDCL